MGLTRSSPQMVPSTPTPSPCVKSEPIGAFNPQPLARVDANDNKLRHAPKQRKKSDKIRYLEQFIRLLLT